MNPLCQWLSHEGEDKNLSALSQRTEVSDMISIASSFSGKPKALTYRSVAF